MNRSVSLSLLLFIFVSFAGVAAADGRHDTINIADFLNNPNAFASPLVEINARVIAINANSKSMELFDSKTRTMILVNLSQLEKSERSALIRRDVRQVSVTGRANMVDGRLLITADSVQIVTIETKPIETKE
jgi:hypothetical protein